MMNDNDLAEFIDVRVRKDLPNLKLDYWIDALKTKQVRGSHQWNNLATIFGCSIHLGHDYSQQLFFCKQRSNGSIKC